jgi:hypothetical protein
MVFAAWAPTASAATVPLNNRTFDAACQAASAGDVITVPAGTYASQTITCAKAVTIQGAGLSTRVQYVAFNGANGPTVTDVRLAGGMESKASQNVAVKRATINNQTYIEATTGLLLDHITWEPETSSTSWGNGDMVDIYPDRNNAPNHDITIQDSLLHGLRSPTTTSHPDAIQTYNRGQSHTGIKILRTKFYDNECVNIRSNPGDELTLENNVFGDSVQGISGCGYYSIDVGYANVMARYNTFTGTQSVQETPTSNGVHQTWIGNAGNAFSAGCGSGGATGATMSDNIWTGQKCGTADKQVASLKIASDGTPQSGSPLIDAGDPNSYVATDFLGNLRYAGLAPDAGAIETGAGGGSGMPDTTAPDTTIASAPANGTSSSASIAFDATESGSSFQCRLDAGAWGSCTSPKAYSGLAAGTHTFDVRATDPAGNTDASPASVTWTISAAPPADTTAPDTTITSAPSDGTSTSASIAFTATESGSTFQCRLDAGSWGSCTSPKAYSGLAVGGHTVAVRGTDASGNTDASPASATWTISSPPPPADTTAPVASIASRPPASTTAASASFGFTATDDTTPAGSLTYRCKLDAGTYAACTSPKAYTGLAEGSHTFSVRATDAAGNASAPVSATWTITVPDTTGPTVTITERPSAVSPSLSTAASIAFVGADDRTATDVLAFQCALDDSPAAPCTSPAKLANLSLGQHTFQVRAYDAAGNASAPASASWLVIAVPGVPGPPPGGGTPSTPAAPTTPTTPTTPTGPTAPVDPTTPGGPTPPTTTLVPPTVSLLKPVAGTRFRGTLKASAAATDDRGVDHVEFWLDGRRFGYDRTAPYAASMVSGRVKLGDHTLVTRAVDNQGLQASVGRVVRHVGGNEAVTARVATIQAASTSNEVSTALLASGPASGAVTVGLASCRDGKAKVVRLVTVRVGRAGRAVPAGGLCVATVALRK